MRQLVNKTTSNQMKTICSFRRKAIVEYTTMPEISDNHVLVKTEYSGISNGTERLILSNNHQKPIALGYSASGTVYKIGDGVSHVKVGDKVACYGAPYVRHAEYILVPRHLAVPVPPNVCMKEAAFVGLGAIAIHAIRQAKLQFGESVIIVGLGILGQIMAQIADAAAFKTIVYDLQTDRCDLFEQLSNGKSVKSIDELETVIGEMTNSCGVDSVLLSANGKNTGLIDGALDWIRDRGRIVIVGDLEMKFSREKMFKKEAEILISRAGGPGRYDAIYEKGGTDYPLGLVRWTEGRNMEEYLRMLQKRMITVNPLISQEVSINQISRVYEELFYPENLALGTLITYD